MIELRDGAGFAIEPVPELRVAGQRRRKDLDRDCALEPRVAGFVDLAHAARAERGHDFVGAETGAC